MLCNAEPGFCHCLLRSLWQASPVDPNTLPLPSLQHKHLGSCCQAAGFTWKFNLLAIPDLAQASHFTEGAAKPTEGRRVAQGHVAHDKTGHGLLRLSSVPFPLRDTRPPDAYGISHVTTHLRKSYLPSFPQCDPSLSIQQLSIGVVERTLVGGH